MDSAVDTGAVDVDPEVVVLDPAGDADGDGVLNGVDGCAEGAIGWTTSPSTDRDGDGCRDSDEDRDDDGDGIIDTKDHCPTGAIGWTSTTITDPDGDGCRENEDDDDGDGLTNDVDHCAAGDAGWTSDPTTDHDADGCRDAGEDVDDDGDGNIDANDACPLGLESGLDRDGDGCLDDESEDDDGDGVLDVIDECSTGQVGWDSTPETDADGDGCQDQVEDDDDDGDRISDAEDPCPNLDSAVFPDACFPGKCTSLTFASLYFVEVDRLVPHGSRLTVPRGSLGRFLMIDPAAPPAWQKTTAMITPTGARTLDDPSSYVPYGNALIGRQRLAMLTQLTTGGCALAEIEVVQTTSDFFHLQFLIDGPPNAAPPGANVWPTPTRRGQGDVGVGLHLARFVGEGDDIDGDGEPDPWMNHTWDLYDNGNPDWGIDGEPQPLVGGTAMSEPAPFDLRLGAHRGPKADSVRYRAQVYIRGVLAYDVAAVLPGPYWFWEVGTLDAETQSFIPRHRCHGTQHMTCDTDTECELGLACDTLHKFEIPEEFRDAYQ
ncbi:MAG: hypothetical protein U1F43_22295 [Myxococcota bacterium]